MPAIDNLRGKYPDSEIHIIGTGPTVSFLPVAEMLRDKITIGLNEAFTYTEKEWMYNISIHPETIAKRPNLNWITKIKGNLPLPWQQYYLFQNQLDVNDFALVQQPKKECLYVGRGIHTAAVVLACEMGARFVYLYGVDCNAQNNIHHSHVQHTQFYGLSSSEVYREYYENLVRLRQVLYKKYEVPLISVSPLLGMDYQREEFDHLMGLHNRTYPNSPPEEIKKYTRPQDKFL